MRRLALSISLVVAMAAPAAAAVSPVGVWIRDNGGLRVRVAPCGAALCGVIIRQDDKSSPAKPGMRVLSGMTPSGPNTWKGSAFNPVDKQTYAGTLTLSGDTLTVSGCVLGLLCQNVVWTRGR